MRISPLQPFNHRTYTSPEFSSSIYSLLDKMHSARLLTCKTTTITIPTHKKTINPIRSHRDIDIPMSCVNNVTIFITITLRDNISPEPRHAQVVMKKSISPPVKFSKLLKLSLLVLNNSCSRKLNSLDIQYIYPPKTLFNHL